MSKLEEKFNPYMYCFMGSGMLSNDYDKRVVEENAKTCAAITIEFAKGFSEFIGKNGYSQINGNWYSQKNTKDFINPDQLLNEYIKTL